MTRMLYVSVAAAAVVLSIATQVAGQSPVSAHTSQAAIYRFSDLSPVAGAYSQLTRGNGMIAMELATGDLVPDAPYTVWWVVFNRPQDCYGACDLDDLFNPDGTMNLNPNAGISVLFADGAMTDEQGVAIFSAVLPEGRALGEVLAGPGLVDARQAEVHLVVRAHGALDLNRAWEQLSTFEPAPIHGGTCVPCEDVQFSVHLPVTARANAR
jgi:hypothetical protein